jgi:hypothetical protein
MEQMDAAIARQWHGKLVSTAMNQHAAIEELLGMQFLCAVHAEAI